MIFFNRGIDDPIGALSVHFIGGIWGKFLQKIPDSFKITLIPSF